MEKILITGGSGFIGTNLVTELLQRNDCRLLNIDKEKPKISEHELIWKQIDLCDKEALSMAIKNFSPDYVIHLAARTDLNGKELMDYDANMAGVSNLLDVLVHIPNLKRAIFASSMYVCEPGYIPKTLKITLHILCMVKAKWKQRNVSNQGILLIHGALSGQPVFGDLGSENLITSSFTSF